MKQEPLFTLEPDRGLPWDGIPQGRKKDIVWDTLVSLYAAPTNKNERGKMNKAVQLIKESLISEGFGDATHKTISELIRQRAFKMTTVWPGISPTEMALANNWKTLKPTVKQICANEKSGWDEETRTFVRATPEQISEWKNAIGFGDRR